MVFKKSCLKITGLCNKERGPDMTDVPADQFQIFAQFPKADP